MEKVWSLKYSTLLLIVLSLLSCSRGESIFLGLCPAPMCDCGLDQKGRMEVNCLHGRMTDIPTGRMHPGTEIIRIVGTKERPNHFAIGRVFGGFKKLEELHIVSSGIPNIGENSFWGVQTLRTLNLTSNNISIIVESNFKGLVNVETLSLQRNNIDSFVSASFQHLPKLKILDLSRNRVNKLVERLFYNLHMLEELDLSWNWVKELGPDVFKDIWRLRVLRARGCGLRSVNPLLYALLPEIRVLDLGSNEFKYLNREEFSSLIHLSELYLDGNQISSITDDTFRSVHLKTLTLGSNRIARIDRHAFSSSQINSLDLSGNQFEILEKQTFASIKKNLTDLDLGRNPRLKLAHLMLILGENRILQRLSLAKNNYDHLPLDLFALNEQLHWLNLSGNRLSELFPHHLSGLGKLEGVDLSWNLFKGVGEGVLEVLRGINGFKELRLIGNPFVCDLCHVGGMIGNGWGRSSDGGCFAEGCLRCSSPPNLANRSLISLREEDLPYCSSGAEQIYYSSDPRFGLFIGCSLLILVLLIASVLIILRSKYNGAYYTNEAERPEVGTPPVPPDYEKNDNKDCCKGDYFGAYGISTIEEIQFVDYPELEYCSGGGVGRLGLGVGDVEPPKGYR